MTESLSLTQQERCAIRNCNWNLMSLGKYLETSVLSIKVDDIGEKETSIRALKFAMAFDMVKIAEDKCLKCESGWQRLYYDSSRKGSVIIKCSKKCGFKKSPFKGTWFENVHLSLKDTLYFLFMWATDRTVTEIMKELGCNEHTAVDHASFCRELVEIVLELDVVQIGGPGLTVEIDESMFRKRKYHKGARKSGSGWVFGGVCRESGECFMLYVPDRSSATLIPIIKERIAPGTRIIADGWSAYKCLNLDPDSDIYTNMVEGSWRLAKRRAPVTGTRPEMKESYLSEFLWKKRNYGQDLFVRLLEDIGVIYKGEQEEQNNEIAMGIDVHALMESCYGVTVPWSECMDPSVYGHFKGLADGLMVSADMLLTAVLFAIPNVLNPNVSIGVLRWHDIHVSCYGWMIIPSGGGKTTIMKEVINKCLRAVSEQKKLEQFILRGYSNVGLVTNIIRNNGQLAIACDEGKEFLEGVRSRGLKGESEKVMLSNLWSKSEYSYTLKKHTREIKESLVNIEMFVQPTVLLQDLVMEKDFEDGYIARSLYTFPKPSARLDFDEVNQLQETMDKEGNTKKVVGVFRKLTHLHQEEGTLRYTFDDDSISLVREMYNDQNPNFLVSDGSERDLEHILRLSLYLQLLNQACLVYREGVKYDRIGVSTAIQGHWLAKAKKLFGCWKRQKSELMDAVNEEQNAKATSQSGPPKRNKICLADHVSKNVANIKGIATGIRDFSRGISGGRKYGEVRALLNHMAENQLLKIVSQDKKKGITGDYIVKYLPEYMDEEKFKVLGITTEQYTINYMAENFDQKQDVLKKLTNEEEFAKIQILFEGRAESE